MEKSYIEELAENYVKGLEQKISNLEAENNSLKDCLDKKIVFYEKKIKRNKMVFAKKFMLLESYYLNNIMKKFTKEDIQEVMHLQEGDKASINVEQIKADWTISRLRDKIFNILEAKNINTFYEVLYSAMVERGKENEAQVEEREGEKNE